MKNYNLAKFVSLGGILTTVAVLFQSAPLFLPVIGLVLSPLSTLPVAIAAVSNISLGFTVFFSSVLIQAAFSFQETLIFFFTTGLIGLIMGILLYRKGIVISILLSSIALSIGILSLTYIVRIPSFVNFTDSITGLVSFSLYYIFSLIYCCIWNILFIKFLKKFLNLVNIP